MNQERIAIYFQRSNQVVKTIVRGVVVMVTFFALAASPVSGFQNRTIDGTGNNQVNPDFGAAITPLIRCCYPTRYPDGHGDEIIKPNAPNARDVSNLVASQSGEVFSKRGLTDWVVQWGQFLTHDMSHTPSNAANNVRSDGTTGNYDIAINDPNDPLGPNPIRFNRADFLAGTGQPGFPPNARKQMNNNTSFIDGSHIYGSDSARAMDLRTGVGGKLRTSAGGLLMDKNVNDLPNQDPFGQGNQLFLAGDVRANENVGLMATHTLFVREHNRLADEISAAAPTMNDEEVYQLARKIVGAELQAITYNEFLPAVLGSNAPRATDFSYDETVNPSMTMANSVAAFRFGHSMQSSDYKLVNNLGDIVDAVSVRDSFFNVDLLDDDPSNVNLLLRGMANQIAQENDTLVVDDIRNFLFAPGAGGTDLLAIDIQRGRDHGLPDYNFLRFAYGLELVDGFDDITSDPEMQAFLASLYNDDISSIDPIVGMLAEDHLEGASVGELTATIIAQQFVRARDGDRFFWLNDSELDTDFVRSLIDLDSIQLSDILRWNTGEDYRNNVFIQAIPEPNSVLFLTFIFFLSLIFVGRRQLRSEASLAPVKVDRPRNVR